MALTQWLRPAFGSGGQVERARRRGRRRPTSRSRFMSQVQSLEDRLVMATLTVTSLADSGAGTLRAAIQASVNHTSFGTVTGTGNDTILFDPSIDGQTISLSTAGDGTAGPSAFGIGGSDALVIDGQTGLTRGVTIASSSGATSLRLFYVAPTSSLTLQGLTVSDFAARGGAGGSTGGGSGAGGGAAGMGGAIFNQGTLTILDSTLTGNIARGGAGGNAPTRSGSGGGGGGGLAGPGGFGEQGTVSGGFMNLYGGGGGPPNGGAPDVQKTEFSYPTGTGGGFGGGGAGGAASAFFDLPSADHGFQGGFGGGGGGGGEVYNSPPPSWLPNFNGEGGTGSYGGAGGFGGGGGGAAGNQSNSGFSGFEPPGQGGFGGGSGGVGTNDADYFAQGGGGGGGGAGMGGAIFNDGGTVIITNSTFAGNSASGGAGGTGVGGNGGAGAGYGGALFSLNGTATVINSTFSRNVAADGGRGISVYGSGGPATASLTNTIIGQSDTSVSDLWVGGKATVTGQTNLIRYTYGATALGSTLTDDPQLGGLASNGGPTQTMALSPDSPAVNAGTAGDGVPATDQRGVLRGVVDIGAFEDRLFANMIVDTEDGGTGDPNALSLSQAIDLANDTLLLRQLSGPQQAQVTPVAGGVSTIQFASGLAGQTISPSTPGDTSVGPSAFLVNSPVVIDGLAGNDGLTLSAAGATMRLFYVASEGDLTLRDLTLSGGSAQGQAGSDNDGLGGAIYNRGTLSILDSTLTGNIAQGSAGGDGEGGAVFNDAGTVLVVNSTFTGNTASGAAGIVNGEGLGGGLFNDNGNITVNNSTFSLNNVVQGDGSTLIAAGRDIYNQASFAWSAWVNSSILGQSDTNIEDFTATPGGPGSNYTYGSNDLIRSMSGLSGDSVVTTADPLLGPLENNGGPTPTMALVGSSPAIGQGALFGVTTDQRGVPRPYYAPDIGAFQRTALHYVVNTTADETTDDSTLSLREAIELVDGTLGVSQLSAAELAQVHASATDTITFDSSLDGSTITLSTVGDTSVGASALLVSAAITINGPTGDSGVTLSAAGTSMRLFLVASGGSLTLQDLTLTGGTAQGSAGGAGLGGAIYIQGQGKLTVSASTLTGNTASGGDGGAGAGGDGKGGAIFNDAGTVFVTNSTFAFNSAIGGTGSTPGKGLGGGLFNDYGALSVEESTISGNVAAQGGRGIYDLGGDAALYSSIIGQSDTSVTDLVAAGAGARVRGALNLIRTMTVSGTNWLSFPAGSGDPMLGPLKNNGGPTPTMAPQAGSPVIGQDKYPEFATDQRGAYRFLPADIGAYEVRPAYNMVVDTTADSATDTDDHTLSLREAIGLANGTISLASLSPEEQAQVTPATGIENTITFAAGLAGQTFTLSAVGDRSVGPSAFLINNRIAIDGLDGDSGVTLSAAGTTMRLFEVAPGGNLTLDHLTISGGDADGFAGGNSAYGPGGGSAGLGGAIYNQGTLSILDSTLTGNTARGGAGGSIDSSLTGHGGGGGGGLAGAGESAPPYIAGNGSANNYGGSGGGPSPGPGGRWFGPYWDPGFRYANGGAGGFGGGGGGGDGLGYNAFGLGNGGAGGFGAGGGGGGDSSAYGGNGGFGGGGGAEDFSYGTPGQGGYGGGRSGMSGGGGGGAGMGGALFNQGGTVVITNSTIAGNAAVGGAGGYYGDSGFSGPGVNGQGLGGGVFNYDGTLTVIDSTLSANTANNGRGIVVLSDGANVTSSAEIDNTILSDLVINQINTGADHSGSARVIGRSNLIQRVSNNGTDELVGTSTVDPQLGGLASNGGPTQTMALSLGSPAIDAGFNPLVPSGVTTDQRGRSRVANGTVDIGAFELATQPQAITFNSLANATYGDADFAISATATSGLPVGFTATGDATVQQVGGVWYVHITGAGGATITAHQAGNASYDAAPDVTQTLNIARASSVTTTVGAGPFTYDGGAQVGGSGTVTGAGGLSTAATSLTYSANGDGTGVADRTDAGTYYVTAHYAGDANHNASDGAAVAIVINAATASITVTPYTVTYDGHAHTATGTATGVNGADLGAGLTLSGTTHTNVGTYTGDAWSFHDASGNYQDAQGIAVDTINPATPTVQVTDAGGTYNQSPFTATATVAGVGGTPGPSLEGVTASLAYYAGSTATGTPLGGAPTLPGTYTVQASFAGSADYTAASAAATFTISTPTTSISGPTVGVPGQPLTYTFAVSGPTQGIVFSIDYGDGTKVTTVAGGPSITLDHIYTGTGRPTIQVTAADNNGVVSTNASNAVAVTTVKMEADVVNPTLTDLAVGGTTSNDTITLSPADAAGNINVNVNGMSLGNFKPSGRILVYGQAGNDVIQLASKKIKGTTYYITAPALIYGGGTGNEVLSAAGSTANNVIIGGGGKNLIIGGLGRDLLIAGLGNSTLSAGSGDDILIGGQTDYDLTSTAMTYDRKLQALDAIMAEWGRTDADYGTRVSHLLGTRSGGLNGSSFLTADTVHSNGVADTLNGSTDATDWFFTDALDTARNKRSGEVVTGL